MWELHLLIHNGLKGEICKKLSLLKSLVQNLRLQAFKMEKVRIISDFSIDLKKRQGKYHLPAVSASR